MSEQTPIIDIQGVSKCFPSKQGEVWALNEIDIAIQPGEIFGIIGMSGAGKSTLVRCINFLEQPTKGRVVVDGMDMATLSDKQLCEARRSIGMIFQQFNLLMQRTAKSNICFPMEIAGKSKEEASKRADELLALVGLADKADAYPAQLSGGQKQRIAIARALATSPKVLLCDEATSALDPTTTRSILGLLKDINQRLGITIVVITHEMAVIEDICTSVAGGGKHGAGVQGAGQYHVCRYQGHRWQSVWPDYYPAAGRRCIGQPDDGLPACAGVTDGGGAPGCLTQRFGP